MSVVPESLLAVATRVEERLRSLIDAETTRWSQLEPELAAPFGALSTLVLSGGKRLRPAFCHWGYVAAGGCGADDVVADAGAAFELLHAFALFHDDVMDGSATRRGGRTTHLAFGDRHEAERWLGEPRRFGEGVAILVGDLAFVYADQLLQGMALQAQVIWNELRIELNIGQYLDLIGTARSERRLVSTERICRYKSGKYTVERPLHFGAALAAPARAHTMQPVLSAYGLPLGDAFQLRDDVLGAFGDGSLTGKPVGDDLREGKPTPLLAMATERATPAQAAALAEIGRPDLTPDTIAEIQAVLIDTGALAALEERIDRLANAALAALDDPSIGDDARAGLAELVHYVAWRDQ